MKIPDASNSIYGQQYEMGLFLNTYYTGETIAINDIGAVDYMADIRCVDVLGLGSMDIATEIKNKSYKNLNLAYYVEKNNVKVVIVYPFLFNGEIPSNWIKVAEWKIPKRMFCAGDSVSFYALKTEDAKILSDNIRSFANQLPKDVEVKIYY